MRDAVPPLLGRRFLTLGFLLLCALAQPASAVFVPGDGDYRVDAAGYTAAVGVEEDDDGDGYAVEASVQGEGVCLDFTAGSSDPDWGVDDNSVWLRAPGVGPSEQSPLLVGIDVAKGTWYVGYQFTGSCPRIGVGTP